MSFLASAGKKTTDIRTFLREAASSNSLKYKAEQGKKHYIHIPCVMVPSVDDEGNEVMTKQIIAQYGDVHEWESPDGKYRATVCLKDVVRKSSNGDILNDGSCPFCERVGDAWEIYKYRCELEQATCGLTGEALTKHMEGIKGANGLVEVTGFKKTAADERKVKEANPYLYLLVVQYRTVDDKGTPVIGQNGLPEYDLKVMKLSKSRVEKLQQQIENSGLQMEGCDVVIEYPKDAKNAALVVSGSVTAPVFPNASITGRYPGLAQAISKDVAKFTWDGLEKAFQEWQGMTVEEAKKTVGELFEKWDEYKRVSVVNPNAKYIEYVGVKKTDNPSIGFKDNVPGVMPVIPEVPSIPGSIPNVNQVFGTPSGPSINV